MPSTLYERMVAMWGKLARLFKGCGLLIVLVGVLVGCVVGIAAALHIGDEPDTLAVTPLFTPNRVKAGEPFTLTVDIHNIDTAGVTIVGVGLGETLLDGASVQAVEPTFRSVKSHSYPYYGDWQEYRVYKYLPADGTLTVTFSLKGLQPGTYTGDVTVWIEGKILGLLKLNRAWREKVTFDVY